jgi:hypothetical protein
MIFIADRNEDKKNWSENETLLSAKNTELFFLSAEALCWSLIQKNIHFQLRVAQLFSLLLQSSTRAVESNGWLELLFYQCMVRVCAESKCKYMK